MLLSDQAQGLRAAFPAEAFSADHSRGLRATAAPLLGRTFGSASWQHAWGRPVCGSFVIERLKEVFGTCGVGWRYAHSPFEEVTTNKGHAEVVTEVALQYGCQEDGGGRPVGWDAQVDGWSFPDNRADRHWSEPILACGGHTVGKGGAPNTDARKSAVTDGITKAASMIGIGHEVFKGLVRVGVKLDPRNMPSGGNGRQAKSKAQGGNGSEHPDATAFWEMYHQEAKSAGVPIKVAQGLAQNGDWATACQGPRTLIAGSKS